MIWLGDLNYRMSLSYDETRTLLEENDWDALLEKDQVKEIDQFHSISLQILNCKISSEFRHCAPTIYADIVWLQLMIERQAGRVFVGWKEGKISFAPTYKYTHNSDAYAGETVKSKKKRRTPAWYTQF
jgi:hypothetical protein